MKKIFIASLALVLAGCGPSEELLSSIEAAKVACMKRESEGASVELVGKISGCRYSNTENYHTFEIYGFSSSINSVINEILFDNFKFPPNVITKIEATSAAMGLQETTMDGANISWSLSVSSLMGVSTMTTMKFNIEI